MTAVPTPSVNYAPLYEYAQQHRVPYNALCVAVREALAHPSAADGARETPIDDKAHPRFMAGYDAGMKDARADARADAVAYRYAANLAQAIFDSEYASDPDYASGKVKWSVCADLGGVLTQIDNMVSGMKRLSQSAAAAKEEK